MNRQISSIQDSQAGTPLSAMTQIYPHYRSGPSSLMEVEVELGVKFIPPSRLSGPS